MLSRRVCRRKSSLWIKGFGRKKGPLREHDNGPFAIRRKGTHRAKVIIGVTHGEDRSLGSLSLCDRSQGLPKSAFL
jgi:hypothetical protein